MNQSLIDTKWIEFIESMVSEGYTHSSDRELKLMYVAFISGSIMGTEMVLDAMVLPSDEKRVKLIEIAAEMLRLSTSLGVKKDDTN